MKLIPMKKKSLRVLKIDVNSNGKIRPSAHMCDHNLLMNYLNILGTVHHSDDDDTNDVKMRLSSPLPLPPLSYTYFYLSHTHNALKHITVFVNLSALSLSPSLDLSSI